MVKKPELPAYTFAIQATLALVYDERGGLVWEVVLASPLVIGGDLAHGPNHLPAGSVLYLPTGQMSVSLPAARDKAGAASEVIAAYEAGGDTVIKNHVIETDELPF